MFVAAGLQPLIAHEMVQRMECVSDATAQDRLYLRGLAIRYERGIGLWLPIMWHLALRGHTGAMVELANWYAGDDNLDASGKAADGFSPAGLYRRAFSKGNLRAASNAAVSCFNRNDLSGYRWWLARAARAGDAEARRQLSWFEIRLWHENARKIRRLRPKLKRDELF